MSESNYSKNNPIIETYRGIAIRKYNRLHVRVDALTYKEIIDIEVDTGLSQRKILAYSGMPCNCCREFGVTVFTDSGEKKIKRGILSKRIPNTSGINQIKVADAKSNRTS